LHCVSCTYRTRCGRSSRSLPRTAQSIRLTGHVSLIPASCYSRCEQCKPLLRLPSLYRRHRLSPVPHRALLRAVNRTSPARAESVGPSPLRTGRARRLMDHRHRAVAVGAKTRSGGGKRTLIIQALPPGPLLQLKSESSPSGSWIEIAAQESEALHQRRVMRLRGQRQASAGPTNPPDHLPRRRSLSPRWFRRRLQHQQC